MEKFYVYILYNAEFDKFYIGQTDNLERRLAQHNEKVYGYTSKYTGEWKLVYNEIFARRKDSMNREKFLKKQKNKTFYKKLCFGDKTITW